MANKTLKQIISMLTAKGEKWADILRYVLYCYNTAYKDTLRETPFLLVYGRVLLVYGKKNIKLVQELQKTYFGRGRTDITFEKD